MIRQRSTHHRVAQEGRHNRGIVKVVLSPNKKICVICFIESPLKKYEKCFLFHLKSSFRFRDIYVFVITF